MYAALSGYLFKIFKELLRTPEKKKVSKRPEVWSLKIQPDIKFNRWSNTTVPVIRLSGIWLEKLGLLPNNAWQSPQWTNCSLSDWTKTKNLSRQFKPNWRLYFVLTRTLHIYLMFFEYVLTLKSNISSFNFLFALWISSFWTFIILKRSCMALRFSSWTETILSRSAFVYRVLIALFFCEWITKQM